MPHDLLLLHGTVAALLTDAAIVIPPEVVETARRSLGTLFASLTKGDGAGGADDFLDTARAFKRAHILERYAALRGKKLLEVGSGFGTNLAVWIRHFAVDGYGIEPGSPGFDDGFLCSKQVLEANAIDPGRIRAATGEAIPHGDESFDIVYSANVLEHTADPEQVLAESLRVLRPGGLLHMETPNFLSYYEGHYLVFQPPLVSEKILPWWVRHVYGRDPSFARTLHTRLNPVWCRRTIAQLGKRYRLELLSTGEEVFLERLARPFEFEMKSVAGRLQKLVVSIQKVNVKNWMGHSIVGLQGHYPMYLTVRKV